VLVDYAFLCDAATESGGKVYALGIGIDRLQVQDVPARHGRMTLATRLRFGADEAGQRSFAIRLVDADGQAVVPDVIGQMSVAIPPPATHATANLLIDLVGAEFRSYGPHEVTLTVDGEDAVTLPLEVVPAG
jgi:hypothetical protein